MELSLFGLVIAAVRLLAAIAVPLIVVCAIAWALLVLCEYREQSAAILSRQRRAKIGRRELVHRSHNARIGVRRGQTEVTTRHDEEFTRSSPSRI